MLKDLANKIVFVFFRAAQASVRKTVVLRRHTVQNVVIAKIHVLNSPSSTKQQLGSDEISIRPGQRPVVTCKVHR